MIPQLVNIAGLTYGVALLLLVPHNPLLTINGDQKGGGSLPIRFKPLKRAAAFQTFSNTTLPPVKVATQPFLVKPNGILSRGYIHSKKIFIDIAIELTSEKTSSSDSRSFQSHIILDVVVAIVDNSATLTASNSAIFPCMMTFTARKVTRKYEHMRESKTNNGSSELFTHLLSPAEDQRLVPFLQDILIEDANDVVDADPLFAEELSTSLVIGEKVEDPHESYEEPIYYQAFPLGIGIKSPHDVSITLKHGRIPMHKVRLSMCVTPIENGTITTSLKLHGTKIHCGSELSRIFPIHISFKHGTPYEAKSGNAAQPLSKRIYPLEMHLEVFPSY